MDIFSFSSSNMPVLLGSGIRSHRMDAAKEAKWDEPHRSSTPSPSLSFSLSPSSYLSPSPSLMHSPSLLVTAPPHPFIFYLLLSSPLIHTQRYAVLYLWLLTIMIVPLPAVSDRKVHRPYSTEKQIMLEKYVKLNRYEEKEQQHWKQMQFNLLAPSSLLDC